MRKDYWNGERTAQMLDQDILCYGKPNSGKTEESYSLSCNEHRKEQQQPIGRDRQQNGLF